MRDALEVLDLTLTLPVGGKTYRVDPPTAAVGAHLANMLARGVFLDALVEAGMEGDDIAEAAADLHVDTETPEGRDFARDCLGAAYDQMLADGIPQPVMELAIATAFLAWTAGKAAAEAYWDTGGKPPAPTATSRTGRPTETRTRPAAASTTRKRGSRSGTKKRKRQAGR